MAALIVTLSIGAFAMATSIGSANTSGKNVQTPSYTGSIKIAQNSNLSEDQEAKALQKLAKITPEQAKSAALTKVNGTVVKVSLEDENGYLVYSVEVKTSSGINDVKVDAGNGKVLHIDKGAEREKESTGGNEEKEPGKELEKGESRGSVDNDTINEEVQQGGEN
ncbi:peptidase M4 [Thermococcus sp. Bubb.Bath]|nr:peptidase M4 [Thermococcus sp. Bubb.Bath]